MGGFDEYTLNQSIQRREKREGNNALKAFMPLLLDISQSDLMASRAATNLIS